MTNFALQFGNPTTIRELKTFLNFPKNDDLQIWVEVSKKGVVSLGFEVPEGETLDVTGGEFGFQQLEDF